MVVCLKVAWVLDLERTVEVLVLAAAEEALDPLLDLFEEEKPLEDFPLVGSELQQVDISTLHLDELPALVGLQTCCPNQIRQSSSSLFRITFPFNQFYFASDIVTLPSQPVLVLGPTAFSSCTTI